MGQKLLIHSCFNEYLLYLNTTRLIKLYSKVFSFSTYHNKIPLNLKILNYIHRISPRIVNLLKTQAPKVFYTSQIFKLYQYNTDFFYRNLYYLTKTDESWINNYKLSSALVEKTKAMDSFNMQINEESVQTLQSFLHKYPNLDVSIVITPYLPIHKSKMKGFDQSIEQLRSHLDVKVYDYTNVLESEVYFGDRVHTNKDGAIVIAGKMLTEGVLE